VSLSLDYASRNLNVKRGGEIVDSYAILASRNGMIGDIVHGQPGSLLKAYKDWTKPGIP
jgi:hypothetical protein